MDRLSLRVPTRDDVIAAARASIQPANALPNIIAGLALMVLTSPLTGIVATAVFALVNALWDSARAEEPPQQ